MPARRLAHVRLAGEHAHIRAHMPADGAPAFALLERREEILRWLVWDGPSSVSELCEHYAHWCFESGADCDYRLAIEERASGALAGSISIRFGGHPGQGDVGYWVGLPFQGRGLGGEALELAAYLAFEHLAAQSLYAWVFVENLASRRILERAGFTLVRTVPGRIVKRGAPVDEWHFVLRANEWRRVRRDFRPQVVELEWEDGPRADPLESPARPFPSG